MPSLVAKLKSRTGLAKQSLSCFFRESYGRFWSPYLGMGNNPVIGVDPDGRYSSFGSWWRQQLHMPFADRYEVADGEWALGWNSWETGSDGQKTLVHHSITEGGPGISGNIGIHWANEANVSYKWGLNNIQDNGVVGLSIDGGSFEIGNINISPDRVLNDPNFNFDELAKFKSPEQFTQGFRVETTYGDVKYKINYDVNNLKVKNMEIGIGAPFLELKAIVDHTGRIHQIRFGSQEDVGRSIAGHAVTADYFTGIVLKAK